MTPAYEPPREGAQLLGRYVLTRPHRDRGLGDLWRARDTLAGDAERLVKLHPLGPGAERDVEALVTRLRGVSAPGLASVLAGGACDGRLVVVYDACAGRSLRHWLDGWRTTQTSPTPGTAKHLFLHLCSVVHEAHGKDLAHERLNPGSAVVTSVTAPKPLTVFDAGVAAFLSGDDQAACVNYLSPEQLDRARKGSAVDPRRADLFALGVILAEILTLRPTPREGTRETWEQLARANPKKNLASLVARPDDVHPELWSLVERLLLNRNDPELTSASKIRQAARKAWDATDARDETPESLREAPQPVEPAVRASKPEAYTSSGGRRDAPLSWEPPPPPAARTPTPPRPARAMPAQARSAEAPAPAIGDTLIDTGDVHSAALAAVRAVRAGAPAPQGSATPRVGGETLLASDLFQGYNAAPGAERAVDASSTLVVDPGPPTAPLAQYVGSSDPFAAFAKKGSDTLAIEDAQPSHPHAIHASAPPHATLAVGARGVPSPPSEVDATRPIGVYQPPHAPVPIQTPAYVAGAPPLAPAQRPAASPWGMKFMLGVIAAGVLIGVLIVAMLRIV